MTDHPLIALVKAANYDLTSAKAKLSEIERQIVALDLAPSPRSLCADCGLTFASSGRLAEHSYLSHDGPEPEHWKDAEARAVAPDPGMVEHT